MSTAACPRPIKFLSPLVAPSGLKPERSKAGSPAPCIPADLSPMPVPGTALPFHLDPRWGCLTYGEEEWRG